MNDYKGRNSADMVKAPPVMNEVDRAVKRVNKQLAPFEQIRRFRILEREFSIETGRDDSHDESAPQASARQLQARGQRAVSGEGRVR
jgi:long-subunit acyl-CoA synthetase (AMP-forming)